MLVKSQIYLNIKNGIIYPSKYIVKDINISIICLIIIFSAIIFIYKAIIIKNISFKEEKLNEYYLKNKIVYTKSKLRNR